MQSNNPMDEILKAVAAQKLEPYMMDAYRSKMSGNKVAPDTIGVDYFFPISFLTVQMEDDFPVIEQAFLNKCRTKLDCFNSVGWYGAVDVTVYNPIQSLRANVLRLIYNGAKLNDSYCIELIKNLYKTYHKSEYNQLKRFNKLSGDAVVSLSENLESVFNEKLAMARVLAMASFMGIEIQEECAIFYYSLMSDREIYLSALDKYKDTKSISEAKFHEYGNSLESMINDAKEKCVNDNDLYKAYLETMAFIEESFKQHGFSKDYMQLCTDEEGSRVINLISSLAILKQINSKKEYSLDDLQIYSSIYQLITAFRDTVSDYDYEVGFILGDQLDDADKDDVLFKPESIVDKEQSAVKESVRLVNVAPIEDKSSTKADYLAEVNNLRGRIREKEQDIAYLRDKCRSLKQSVDENSNIIKSLEADRDELIALRNFVHNLEDEEIPDIDELPKMQEAISNKKITIIGGHQNWHNKLKKLFPGWTYVYMDEYKAVTASMLENRDYVFFYHNYISHKSYNKCVAMLRENNIPFGYLSGVNTDFTIRQVYEGLMSK